MYRICRCRKCKHEIHVHKIAHKTIVKNGCEHVPNGDITKSELDGLFK